MAAVHGSIDPFDSSTEDWLTEIDISQTDENTETDPLPTPVPPRRSTRNRQQPDRFAPLVQQN